MIELLMDRAVAAFGVVFLIGVCAIGVAFMTLGAKMIFAALADMPGW